MSSLRNAIPRRGYKERAQPSSRKKFGLLEKHKDYVERAKAYHNKEDTLRRLREKAANRNPDEFYFKMIRTKTVNGVHRSQSDSQEEEEEEEEERLLMKTQDMAYVLQKLKSERKKIQKLTTTLHCIDNQLVNKRVFFAKDSKTKRSYRELDASRNRLNQLEKTYLDMTMQKELQKKGKKCRLPEDELVGPTTKPVYKWRAERKR